MTRARTIKELRDSGWQRKSVKQELRDNLVARLRSGDTFLPGIVGYDDTVVPQIENAVLSGQDLIFLGERGQAKTRIARLLVGLLNIMEERDVQIRGYKVRLPLDLYVVASANPEDYTNRGRIITPLKDRFGSQVRTHYPKKLDDEIAIMEAERTAFPVDGVRTASPEYMRQIVAELTHLARASSDISQRSGVSVRVSICNYENLLSSALKRAIRLDESLAVPRVSDLSALAASTTGKIELETVGDGGEDKILTRLTQKAVLNVFGRSFGGPELAEVVKGFEGGSAIQASDTMPSVEYVKQAAQMPGLRAAAAKLGATEPAAVAAAMEFVLEGLHLSKKLNKDVQAGRYRYRS